LQRNRKLLIFTDRRRDWLELQKTETVCRRVCDCYRIDGDVSKNTPSFCFVSVPCV